MRLFFAAWPPPEVGQALAGWAREAQRVCAGRATRADRIHLTLSFLGEADPEAARAAASCVRSTAASFSVRRYGYWAHNRILWAGPADTPPALAALARALGETREFTAHVTLIRDARAPGQLPPLPALEWPVAEFRLVNSTLGRRGPDYEVLGRYALE